MKKRYLLAHDLGTSGNKAALFSEDGELAGSQTVEYQTHYFHTSWAEQDAEDWWNAVCRSTRELLEQTAIPPEAVCSVSFSGQMMGCLCVDRTGRPLRPAIIWADQRAQKQAEEMRRRIGDAHYYRTVGHPLTASYGMCKLMWVRENEPEIYEQTWQALNAKDYIAFRLTGKMCTDYSDANSFGFFDLDHLRWADDLIAETGIDPAKLPQPVASTTVVGAVTENAAAACGLMAGTPVVMGAGDGAAANVGAGAVQPGEGYCCLGTSAWIGVTTRQPVYDNERRTVTWAHMIPGLYAANGTMQYAAGCYQWLRNVVGTSESEQARREGISPYELMDAQAQSSPPGANGLLFLPYLLGERAPLWDSSARGCWIGLKAETTRGDLVRSVLEGVAMNLAMILEALQSQLPVRELTVIGGGAKGMVWRHILADILNVTVKTPNLLEEAGSVGAAVNAGVGVGLYSDFSAVHRFLHTVSVEEPDPVTAAVYRLGRQLFEESYRALRPLFQKIARGGQPDGTDGQDF